MQSVSAWSAAARGFLLCAGLIVAIGPQNLFVIRMGREPRYRLLASALCAACDAALIAIGLFGAGSLILRSAWTMRILGILGGALLLRTGMGLLVAETAAGVRAGASATLRPQTTRRVVRDALGFSLLNPHALLDTIIVIGSVGTLYGPTGRWYFGLGACAASCVWYWLLGRLGGSLLTAAEARGLSRWFDRMSGLILIGFSLLVTTSVFRAW